MFGGASVAGAAGCLDLGSGSDDDWGPEERPGELFRESFSDAPTGAYDPSDSDWGGYPVEPSHTEHLFVEEREEGGKMLATRYPEGPDGVGSGNGGGNFRVAFGAPQVDGERYEELYLAYQVRFREGFQWQYDGGKLPGLIGGQPGELVTGGDTPTGENGWSARMMWRDTYTGRREDGGDFMQYVYYPDKSNPDFGENMRWFESSEWDRSTIYDGEWYWIEHRVKMNDPGPDGEEGESDGLIQGWFDGKLALDERNLRFRDVADFGVDRLYFDTFFGGPSGDPAYAHDREEWIDYDHVVVSTEPITHGEGGVTETTS